MNIPSTLAHNCTIAASPSEAHALIGYWPDTENGRVIPMTHEEVMEILTLCMARIPSPGSSELWTFMQIVDFGSYRVPVSILVTIETDAIELVHRLMNANQETEHLNLHDIRTYLQQTRPMPVYQTDL